MQTFLTTERLVLRRFTTDDVDNLAALDADPEVIHFITGGRATPLITGGRATPREEIQNDVLPAFLRYYERYAGFGFWAALERSTGAFLGWFHFRPRADSPPNEVELGYR